MVSGSHASDNQMMDNMLTQINTYKNNFTHQVNETFTRLTPKDLIRIVIIVGAYSFLRPYLLKLGARFQAKDHEREIDHEEIQEMRKSEGYNKDSIKGRVEIPDDTDSEDEAVTRTGMDWGKAARQRQRRVMKQLLDAEEKKRLDDEEAESDKELEQFMIS